jgi:DNA-directed RNA polymerase subunit M/transcription elongation factor TFIIS
MSEYLPREARCPDCGNSMYLVQIGQRDADAQEFGTYLCETCGDKVDDVVEAAVS